MAYPFASITINNREISFEDVLDSKAHPQSAFEQSSFDFIRRWFSQDDEFILNTSGSTGTPKEIIVTRWQMLASATATARALDLASGQTAFICLDPKYIAGQMMFVRSFNTGLRIIATDPAANPLSEIPERTIIDFMAVVPYQLEQMLQPPTNSRLNNVRTIIIGGAAIPKEITPGLDNYSCTFVATYGMTETISHVALQSLNGPTKTDCFTTLPGVELGIDARGCLIIRAPYLDHPLVTNDIVSMRSSNQFEWLGRFDNIINSGGVKVSPEHVEAQLKALKMDLSLHARFVISSRKNRMLGEEVILVIEAKGIDNDLEAKLKEAFPWILDRFEIPREILCVYPFPETKTGKIDRTALKSAINRHH